jgi:putative FmdB family regulatory protein
VPTYQYACTACGHQLEAVQSFKDEPLTVCPECEGRLRKLFSSVGVVFKGSGFYRTDNRPKEPSSASSSSTKSDSAKSDSTKSDSSSSTSSTSSGSSSSDSSSSSKPASTASTSAA